MYKPACALARCAANPCDAGGSCELPVAPIEPTTCRAPPPLPPPLSAGPSAPSTAMEPALALLHAIARRDLPAVQAALEAGAELRWRGIPALHVAALCDWAEPVSLLVHYGGCFWPGWVCMGSLLRAWQVPVGTGLTAHPSIPPLAGASLDAHLETAGPSHSADTAVVARLQGVGVPGELCSAVLPLASCKTALALAVRCGAAATASALVTAGAATAGAFAQLVELARWKGGLRGIRYNEVMMPVQQCAEALLAAPLPDGPALFTVHQAAA